MHRPAIKGGAQLGQKHVPHQSAACRQLQHRLEVWQLAANIQQSKHLQAAAALWRTATRVGAAANERTPGTAPQGPKTCAPQR